jgi:foldase protein PrsA
LLLLVALAGCGGGSDDVPADAVAVVDGQKVPKSDYDDVLAQVKKSYKNQKREVPKAGSQEFQTLKNQIVQYLVQRVQFEQEAEALEIEVTDKQVDARLEQVVKQYFQGDRKKFEAQLKEQGSSERQVRNDIRAQIVSERLFAEVTGEVKVTDKQVEDYYNKNKAQYSQPESREVRHILVKTRAQADDLYDQLKAGADFAVLAKKFSEDTGSKANGGKLTISKGQTVAPFDQTAFVLKKNEISKPVKTQYGFHLIQPIGDVKEAKVTPLEDVKDSIRQQLAQTKKNEAMTKWVDGLNEEYEDMVSYAVGFNPPHATSTSVVTVVETKR